MNTAEIDWSALDRLRATFLAGSAGQADYWGDERDLTSYDATFAQRIGWKWDHVLAELSRRGWKPPRGPLLDWGCGSGIAGRAFLDFFHAEAVTGLWLRDRSARAMDFAARRARDKYPGLAVHQGLPCGEGDAFEGTLLLSHVLNELDAAQLDSLLSIAAGAASIIWIEPGAHDISRAFGAVRERLRERFEIVAPCPHQGPCAMLAPGNERHWCHHFASPPSWVFTDGNWARFAMLTGIDLRSLPLSYLVLDRRIGAAATLPADAARTIGQPRVYKAFARIFACDETGVRDRELSKRSFPELFRKMKKGHAPTLLALTTEASGKVTAAQSLEGEISEPVSESPASQNPE